MLMMLVVACLQRDTLDLSHGQREFLSRELAEDALEPLLADGATVTRVSHGLPQLIVAPRSAQATGRCVAMLARLSGHLAGHWLLTLSQL